MHQHYLMYVPGLNNASMSKYPKVVLLQGCLSAQRQTYRGYIPKSYEEIGILPSAFSVYLLNSVISDL